MKPCNELGTDNDKMMQKMHHMQYMKWQTISRENFACIVKNHKIFGEYVSSSNFIHQSFKQKRIFFTISMQRGLYTLEIATALKLMGNLQFL